MDPKEKAQRRSTGPKEAIVNPEPTDAQRTGQEQSQSRNGDGRHIKDGPWAWLNKKALQLIPETFDLVGQVASARSVYLALCELASDAQKETFPATVREIGCRAGVSYGTAFKVLMRLEAVGLLSIKRRDKQGSKERLPSVYTLLDPLQGGVMQPLHKGYATIAEKTEEPHKKQWKCGNLGRKEILKSKAGARAHGAFFSLSAFPEEEAEIVQRFNKSFVPKGAQPVNKAVPKLRDILRHCGWGDYTAFEKAALADHKNWPKRFKTKAGRYKRPGFVALWHAYKPFPKGRRLAKPAWLAGDIDTLKARVTRWRDRRDDLYREDPKGNEKERVELQKKIDATDEELERRNVNVEAMRNQRAARRSEQEHEAIKHEPIILWLNGKHPKVHSNGKDEVPRDEQGYRLHGKFLSAAQVNQLALHLPAPEIDELLKKAQRAIRRHSSDGNAIIILQETAC